MDFKQYLESEGLSPSTVLNHVADLRRFDEWCKGEGYNDYTLLHYRDLMGFVDHMRNKGVGRASINIHMNSVTKYYEYLIAVGLREDNPARRLRVKKDGPKVNPDLLKPTQLDTLYTDFKNRSTFREEKHRLRHHRNTIILGLVIYQALHATDLKALETFHIDYDNGLLEVPETSWSTGRVLKLHPSQILSLYQYTTVTRPQMQKEGTMLFGCDVNNVLWLIIQELKRIHPETRNMSQLRTSVLVNWVRHYGIRQSQYMAGHRHISSTESYRVQDIESLQEAVFKYHPLG